LAGAVAALWLCGAGSAWAGGGGGPDAGPDQTSLDALCSFLGVTSCPQLPTVTQIVLEYAALGTSSPDFVRGPGKFGGFGGCSVAGNLGQPCDTFGINAVSRPTPSPIGLPDLGKLTPLAFTINKQGQAVPTQPSNPSAVGFLYAVTTTTGKNGQPDTLQLFYDYPPLTSSTFATAQTVAEISLPLQVLNTDGSERLVCGPQGCPASVATLLISAVCNGGVNCLTANVFGNFSPAIPNLSPNALGLQWQLVFGTSPNSKNTHAIFEVLVPLLVTGPTNPAQCGKAISAGTPDPADCGNDPAYFGVTPAGATNGVATGSPTGINQITGLPTAFSTNDLGFTPASLGAPLGVAPFAAPACLGGNPCPRVPPLQQSTFPFCASFSVKGTLNRAVAAFLAIATDGTTDVSAPVVPPSTVTCPF
jgi:hypothetical protein